MTTTELYSGHTGNPSSRVLQPPGGGSSNIFGDEPPRQPRQQVQQPAQDQNQNQAVPAGPGASQQQRPAQQQQQQGAQGKNFKNRGGVDPAPYASFAESGKKSTPSQFDDCSPESQNDADFRCYSVTAYREQMQENAAVRQRARGSAMGVMNPITHEETGQGPRQGQGQIPAQAQPNPFQTYEQARVHPQQVAMERGSGRKAGGQQRQGTFNPITGEEYPPNYGQA